LALGLCQTAAADTPNGLYVLAPQGTGYAVVPSAVTRLPSCGEPGTKMLGAIVNLRVIYARGSLSVGGQRWVFDSNDGDNVEGHDPTVNGRARVDVIFWRVGKQGRGASGFLVYWGLDDHGIETCAEVRGLTGTYKR